MIRRRGLRKVVPMPLTMALKAPMDPSSAPRSDEVEDALNGEQELGHQLGGVAAQPVGPAAVVGQVLVDEPDSPGIDLDALGLDGLDELEPGPARLAVPRPGFRRPVLEPDDRLDPGVPSDAGLPVAS